MVILGQGAFLTLLGVIKSCDSKLMRAQSGQTLEEADLIIEHLIALSFFCCILPTS